MTTSSNAVPTFHIGLTMAGAGSAGCYTSGVMDYLFEILDLWERAKTKNLPGFEDMYTSVPQHNVLIDVMGGTSAGGITTVIAALYALSGNINPFKDPLAVGQKTSNILYDTWVNLDDDFGEDGIKTFTKAWNLEDLQDGKLRSIINSQIIDHIADRALEVEGNLTDILDALPSYISKDLDILQAHTMLRGIPLSIDFSSKIGDVKSTNGSPTHNSFEHYIVSHYKLNNGSEPSKDQFLWFNPYEPEHLNRIALTTKSTGAFPVGLKFREIDQQTFTDNYIKCVTEFTIFNMFGQKEDTSQINWKNFPTPFNFLTIDGGAINNEPFGEVLGILKSRYGNCMKEGYAQYGIVMIDPFPDEVDNTVTYDPPTDLFGVVPAIIGTLYEQSKVKKDDMVEATENPYFRGEIFPRRWKDGVKQPFPIASASVGAFGGFLDIRFRHYDFFLGRDNARNYFQYYFSFEYYIDKDDPKKNIVHPIHESWTREMIENFSISKDGKTYLPIIPDLNILLNKKRGIKRDAFKYSIEDKPVYNPKALFENRQLMEDRFEKILDIAKLKTTSKSSKPKNKEADKWMNKFYHKSWWDNLKGIVIKKSFNVLFSMTKGGLARNITEMAVKGILADLDKRQFLKAYDDR
jgi:hypothetical protein